MQFDQTIKFGILKHCCSNVLSFIEFYAFFYYQVNDKN